MDIGSLIKEVEKEWLNPLFTFSESHFKDKKLPSHDHLHHLRAWGYVKNLVQELEDIKYHSFSKSDIENIIFAVFFHDTGLTHTIGPDHGKASARFFQEYLLEHKIDLPGKEKVIEAIDKHDDKEYKTGKNDNLILNILCACDDADAFSAIGGFRYLEIYFLRGIKVEQLPEMIISNLDSRYSNIKSLFPKSQKFLVCHEPRYKLVRKLYSDLSEQIELQSYSEENFTGAIGVVNFLKKYVINGNVLLQNISDAVLKESQDNYITAYFNRLKEEVKIEKALIRW